MAEVYVTLGEAAELERVKYNTMVKRVLRKQESFVTKTEKSENGGKDVVLVAVSSLSKQARNAWKEREKLKSFTEEFPDKKEDEQKPEVPWYVNTDVDWYIENYKERYYKAVELGNVVRKFLQYDEGDRTKQARAELKKRMQDKGVLPPDKPKLNRKKFIDEAREEWNGRSSDCFIWEHYLMDAISYMLCQREGMSSRASLEAVGAAKVLKLAIRLREFSEEVREKGEHEYKLVDQYNYIKDILDA